MNTGAATTEVGVIATSDAFKAATQGRKAHKHSNYFEIYDRYLARFRNKEPKILEIGVQHGGSLLMWDAFFGGRAKIVGMDILPECKKFEGNNVQIFIGDQSDDNFLADVIRQTGKFDIIIDDGSHVPRHQIASFNFLFYNGLSDNGVYLCEDCATSYWPSYGGGVRKHGSFIEFAKRLVDDVNAWAVDSAELPVTDATKWIKAISFYAAVVVFEKAPIERPESLFVGHSGIDLEADFRSNKYAFLILPLKRSATVQRLVRTNPFLWNLMRRFLKTKS